MNGFLLFPLSRALAGPERVGFSIRLPALPLERGDPAAIETESERTRSLERMTERVRETLGLLEVSER